MPVFSLLLIVRSSAVQPVVWLIVGVLLAHGTPGPCSAQTCTGSADSAVLFQWSGQTSDSTSSQDDEDTIVGDRPDFTEALSTVGRGRIQMEIGYTYSRDNDGTTRVRSHTYPQALFRIGMFADWLEFRIASTVVDQTTRDGTGRQNRRGAEDLYLGFKVALTEQDGLRPAMALIPQMLVPTGATGFTNDEVLPGLNWIYGWDLTDNWSLGGSTQANRALDSSDLSFTEFAQSVVTGVSLTDRLGTYAEWFMFTPHSASADVSTEHYLDGGFTFLVSNNLQLDILAGVGLNDAADDFFGGGGLAVRY